jgi:hypothetical protein
VPKPKAAAKAGARGRAPDVPSGDGQAAAAPRKRAGAKAKKSNGVTDLVKELWEAAVNLRGSIEPADYKRYVLPIIFLRFLSLRYERRRHQLTASQSCAKHDSVRPLWITPPRVRN